MEKAYEDQYHRVESDHWWFLGRRQIVRALVLGNRPDRRCRILEMGCSGGQLIRQLQGDGYREVAGIDISPDAIALCRRAGLEAQVMDAQQLSLPEASFDVITASDVLEHLADEQKALQEWGRVLRPGGLLVVFVPAFMFLWTAHDEANRHYRRYRRGGLCAALQAGGFVVERSAYWNAFLFPPIAAIRVLRKLLPKGRPSSGAGDLFKPPAAVNALLTHLLLAENRLMCAGVNWPFGVSVMALARKPQAKEARGERV